MHKVSKLKETLKQNLKTAPLFYKFILTFIAGVSLSFIQAPYNLWPLIFLCFGLFFLIFQFSKNKKEAFFTSYLFSLGYFIAGLYWIGNALLVEGNDYAWAWPMAVIGLPVLLAFFPALFLTIGHIALKNSGVIAKYLGFCLALGFAEWVRGFAFTGFPWNLYGYTWAGSLPIAQTVSLIGPYGLSFLTLLWGGVLGLWLAAKMSRSLITLSLVIFVIFSGSYLWGTAHLNGNTTQFNEQVNLEIIQPNIAQADKWRPEKLVENFEIISQLSTKKFNYDHQNITIWPETTLPPSFINDPAINERIYGFLGVKNILLAGALNRQENPNTGQRQFYNALLAWTPEARAKQVYAKSHLVPFGEYIPFQNLIPLKTVTNFSGFAKGDWPQTITIDNLPSFKPLICYESIFPQLALSRGKDRPSYIAVITNDAWYGDSPGPYQHFAQSQFRAIENGIPVMRAANTGVSGVIDGNGRILNQASLNERGVLNSYLPLMREEPTLYARLQDWPFLCLLFLLSSYLIYKRNSSL